MKIWFFWFLHLAIEHFAEKVEISKIWSVFLSSIDYNCDNKIVCSYSTLSKVTGSAEDSFPNRGLLRATEKADLGISGAGSPFSPLFPSCPVSPFSPRGPVIPISPLTPWGPIGPVSPLSPIHKIKFALVQNFGLQVMWFQSHNKDGKSLTSAHFWHERQFQRASMCT